MPEKDIEMLSENEAKELHKKSTADTGEVHDIISNAEEISEIIEAESQTDIGQSDSDAVAPVTDTEPETPNAVDICGIHFLIENGEGGMISKSGTVKINGSDAAWTSEGIDIRCTDGKYTAAGAVNISADAPVLKEALSKFTYIYKGIEASININDSVGGLSLSVNDATMCIGSFGVLSVVSDTTANVEANVTEDGQLCFKFPDVPYRLRVLNNLVSFNIPSLGGLNATLGAKIQAIDLNIEDTSLGDYTLNDIKANVDLSNKSVSLKLGSIKDSDEKLMANNIGFHKNSSEVEADEFTASYNDENSIGKLDFTMNGFKFSKDGGFEFKGATADIKNLNSNSVKQVNGQAKIYNEEGFYGITAEVSAAIAVKNTALMLQSEKLDISLAYRKKKGETGDKSKSSIGAFCATVKGELECGINVQTKEVFKAKTSDIAILNQGISLGTLNASLNLDNLNKDIKASATLSGEEVVVGKGFSDAKTLNIVLSNVKYKDTDIFSRLNISYKLGEGWKSELTAGFPKLEFKHEPFTIGLENYKLAATYDTALSIGIVDAAFSAQYGDHMISANKLRIMLGKDFSTEEASYSNDSLNEACSELGIEKLALFIKDLKFEKGKSPQFSAIGLRSTGAIPIFDGFSLTEIGIAVNTKNFESFEGFTLSGGLKYEGENLLVKSFSGNANIGFLKENQYKPKFSSAKNITLAIAGYGSGSAEEIESKDGKITIKKCKFKGGNEPTDGVSDKLLSKLISVCPDVDINIEKIVHGPNGFEPLDKKDIRIMKISKEISITDGLKALFTYDRDKGISAKLTADYYIPSSRKTSKEDMSDIVRVGLPIKTPIPLLSFNVGAFVKGGADFKGEISAGYAENTFTGGFKANGNASIAAGVDCKVIIGPESLGLSADLSGEFAVNANLEAEGGMIVDYNPDAQKFKDSFSINREKNPKPLKYNMGANIVFNVKARAGANVPKIFNQSNKKLYKEWTLFTYPIGNVTFQGEIKYENGKYRFENKTNAEFLKALSQFDVDTAINSEVLEKMSDDVNRLDVMSNDVYDILNANPDCCGFGAVRDSLRIKQSLMVAERIQNAAKTSNENTTNILNQLELIEKILPKVINKRNDLHQIVSRRDEIISNTKSAMTVIGVKSDDGKALSYNEIIDKVQEMLTDDKSSKGKQWLSKIDRLARLDPMGVYNIFKAYRKKRGVWEHIRDSWSSYYETAKKLSEKMHTKNTAKPVAKPTWKEQRKKTTEHNAAVKALSNSYKLSNKDFSATAGYLNKINKANENVEKLRNERDKISSAPQNKSTQKKLASLNKQILAKENQLTSAKDDYNRLIKKHDESNAASINTTVDTASESLAREKESTRTSMQEMITTYNTELNLSEENIAANKKFVISLMNHIKSEGKASGDELNEQAKRNDERLQDIEKGKLHDESMYKDVHAGYRNVDDPDKALEEWQKNYDNLMSAHDKYMKQALDFQRIFKKANELHETLIGKRFTEPVSESAAQENNALLNTGHETLVEFDSESQKITSKDIQEINNALEKAQTA